MAKGDMQLSLVVKDKGSKVINRFVKSAKSKFKSIGKSLKKALDSKVISRFARQTETRLSKMTNTIKSRFLSLKKVIIGVGVAMVALAAVKLVGFFKEAVSAASSLEEATGKFDAVFKEQAGTVKVWAKELQTGYATSERESLQFLSSIQDLLVPMGMASEEAAKMSFEVVKLAADLGSFNDMPTARVLADLQSALVGNGETMKKYGVIINETTIKAEALRMKLVKSGQQLTISQKAQAAFSLAVKGSAAAIGDMARTAGGFANKMKDFNARLEDFKAAIGKPLLGPLGDIISKMTEWLKKNDELIASEVGEYITTISDALESLYDTTTKYKTELSLLFKVLIAVFAGRVAVGIVTWALKFEFILKGVSVAAGSAAAGALAFGAAWGLIGTVVGAVSVAFGTWLTKFEVVQQAGIALAAGLEKKLISASFGIRIAWLAVQKLFLEVIFEMKLAWSKFINFLLDKLPKAIKKLLDLPKAVSEPLRGAVALVEEKIKDLHKEWDKSIKRTDDIYSQMFNEVGNKINQIKAAAKSIVADIRGASTAASKATPKTDKPAFFNYATGTTDYPTAAEVIITPKIKMSPAVPFKQGVREMNDLIGNLGSNLAPVFDMSGVEGLVSSMRAISRDIDFGQFVGRQPRGFLATNVTSATQRSEQVFDLQLQLLKNMVRQGSQNPPAPQPITVNITGGELIDIGALSRAVATEIRRNQERGIA